MSKSRVVHRFTSLLLHSFIVSQTFFFFLHLSPPVLSNLLHKLAIIVVHSFMASSSSSSEARSIVSAKLYDVFVSHRGPDVKHTLAIQLYDLLQERGCNSFLDREEIEGGDCITAAIRNAICSSRVQIAIFSKGFAESSWCLDELVLMLLQTDALFIPLFYGVQPWELRHIDQHAKKKSQYAKAFADYQRKGRNLYKLDGWKRALASAADISGYELGHHQEDLWEEIVSRVVQVVQEKEKSTPLHVAKYPIGLHELVHDFERCCSKTAGTVGIFGLGGSGKTTLAKELFNRKSSGYHRSSFLSDVRESNARSELHSLQNQLLKDLFSRDEEIRSVDHGMGKLKDHLGRAKHLHFLIVVDDIDHQHQLDALLPEGILGCGSLVIITTRDRSLLRGIDVRYEMKEMDRRHAEDLFCSHAFRRCNPPAAYQKLVESFVKFCGGLPLSLIVLGAHVYERELYYWKLELEKVKKIPPAHVMKRLKISFDGLDTEEKQIFIDIACFFNKKNYINLKNKAITIWKASGWSSGEHALQTLQDKCLIKMTAWDTFEMHDHLRDLGRQMADELGPPRLWQPQLLRSMEAKGFKQILAETKGRCFHSFEDSSLKREITYFIADTDLVFLENEDEFEKLYNIPSWIPLQKLHYLSIFGVEDLWSSIHEELGTHAKATFELRTLHIHHSPSLQKLPNLIKMCTHLEELEIWGSLEKTDTTLFMQSLKHLINLRTLFLGDTGGGLFRGNLDISKGRDCSRNNRMDSLETIQLDSLQNIFKLVISGDMCPKLQTLQIRWMKNLKEIELKSFPKVADCSCLEEISIIGCPELQRVQGVEELLGLKSLVIEVPDNRNALARTYIGGLKSLSVKKTILLQEAMDKASSKLNRKLFSKVIDTKAISQIERGEYTLKMNNSSSAIIIYALLVTPNSLGNINFESGPYCHIVPQSNWLITVVLTAHDSEDSLMGTTTNKVFKVTVKLGEEDKALIVLRRIVDQLYMRRTIPTLAAYDVVKRKRKLD